MNLSTTPAAPAALRIDFSLDLICPWCWIGLRNLLSARDALLAQSPAQSVSIHWHADTLLPHIPKEGVPYQAFYEARLGGTEKLEARRAQVRAAAQAAGLTINHGLIQTFPNTRLVCALVNYAQLHLDDAAMIGFVESIFNAYFVQGRDIGSTAELHALTQAAGLAYNPASFDAQQYQSTQGHAGGVPHMVFNQQLQVTGAVSPNDLLRAMVHVLAEQHAD
ncbi:MAG: DsbA family protein [Comamonas sp.]